LGYTKDIFFMKTAQYTTNSPEKLITYAGVFAHTELRQWRLITCVGPLGAGKTTFIQGLAKGLGIRKDVLSPTFTIINEHKIPQTKKTLVHCDLYRLTKERDLTPLHVFEYLENPNMIVCVEWADRFPQLWKTYPRIALEFSFRNKNERRIKIRYFTGR